ncbi:hypothetical protein VTO73DRAFT_12603 [Trametes versicolor]
MSDSDAKPMTKPWDGCPYCKELFGQVYREHIKLADIVAASTSCTRCWALVEILRRVTDVSNTVTTLVGSIWHNNTLQIGVISPGYTFETAPGYEIYVDDDSADNVARTDPVLGVPIMPKVIREMHHTPRPIEQTPERRLALAKRWLTDCLNTHDTCNADTLVYKWPYRVLDISDDTIVKLVPITSPPPNASYVALSYCWGPTGNLCTLKDNLKSHTEEGIIVSQLPPTIRDAIFVTKHLGQTFLWVDALCIVQDDDADKIAQIPLMADIYSGALLVLSAAASTTVLDGCPLSPRDKQPLPPQTFSLSYPPGSSADPTVVTIAIEQMEHERCRALPGHWAHETFDQDPIDVLSPIERRAWTFQERFLSPRTLILGTGELSWLCGSAVCCECRVPGPDVLNHFGERVFTQKYGIAHVSMSERFERLGIGRTYSYAWVEAVSKFAGRRMGYFTDRVAAVEGAARAFQMRWPGVWKAEDYVFGCWVPLLGDLLAWRAEGEKVTEKVDRGLFPSWAWPSCGRGVDFTSWIWYGVDPKLWAEVVDLRVEMNETGGFGTGRGTLTLSAPVIPARGEAFKYYNGEPGVMVKALDPKLDFIWSEPTLDDLDAPDAWKEVTHLLLLASYPYRASEKFRPLCFGLLCLAPSSSGRENDFRRVGMIMTGRVKKDFLAADMDALFSPHNTTINLI